MSRWKYLPALAVVLALPVSAQGFGFRWLFGGGSSTSYYYPAPAPYYAAPAVIYPPCPPYAAPPMRGVPPVYAAPVPAPPSFGPVAPRPAPAPTGGDPAPPQPAPKPPGPDTLVPPKVGAPEPGEKKPFLGPEGVVPPPIPPPEGPGVRASRSFYDAYPVAARDAAAANGERCQVGIWNLSARDVEIVVEGRTHYVARGRKWSGQLPRTFRWQLAGKETRREQVPERDTGLEIVIRK